MKKWIALSAASAAIALPAVALAASPADECAAAGGTYVKDGSTAKCEFPVGNSDNVKTVDQKGSFNSSHDEGYTNPGGNQPSGQQGGNTIGN